MKVMPSSCRWLGIQMGVPPVIIHFFIGFSIHKPSRNWYPHDYENHHLSESQKKHSSIAPSTWLAAWGSHSRAWDRT